MNIKRVPVNESGRDFICGDIHGCYSLLYSELDKLNFDESKDRLFCTGDLVDRGPESLDVLDIIDKSWFHSVLGNHDLFACEFYANKINQNIRLDYESTYKLNGGDWFISLDTETQRIIANKFSKLPIAIELESKGELIGIVHADCPFNDWNIFKFELQEPNRALILECIWNRNRVKNKDQTYIDNIDRVYHGHTVLENVEVHGNRHYIDTGAVFYNKLTIIEL
jgi:serine/threonine protein phosphatase 1